MTVKLPIKALLLVALAMALLVAGVLALSVARSHRAPDPMGPYNACVSAAQRDHVAIETCEHLIPAGWTVAPNGAEHRKAGQ